MNDMMINIFVGIMCAAVLGAGIWVWWSENGGSSHTSDTKKGNNQDSASTDSEAKEHEANQ